MQISNIKKFTTEQKLFEALETFTPKAGKRDTLPDLFRNIRKEKDKETIATDKNSTDKKRPLELHGGFITAKQLEECKKIKLDPSQPTINSFFKSEVSTTKDGKQVKVGETSDRTNKMEDKNREDKLKMLFGDESDGEEVKYGESKENGDKVRESEKKKHEECVDKQRDHKHAKRKCEKERKRKNESKIEDVSDDKKHCTKNETKVSENVENGASSSKKEEVSNKKQRPKLKKSEIGTLVVKLLTPAYAERRFDSRDTFKSTARSISHALLDKGV